MGDKDQTAIGYRKIATKAMETTPMKRTNFTLSHLSKLLLLAFFVSVGYANAPDKPIGPLPLQTLDGDSFLMENFPDKKAWVFVFLSARCSDTEEAIRIWRRSTKNIDSNKFS